MTKGSRFALECERDLEHLCIIIGFTRQYLRDGRNNFRIIGGLFEQTFQLEVLSDVWGRIKWLIGLRTTRFHVGITWMSFWLGTIVYWEWVESPWRWVTSNLKELGQHSSGLVQHCNGYDRFLWYYRALHVFCGNIVGYGSLCDLGDLVGSSSAGLVMCIWAAKSLRWFWTWLAVGVFYWHGELVVCCGFILNWAKRKVSGRWSVYYIRESKLMMVLSCFYIIRW